MRPILNSSWDRPNRRGAVPGGDHVEVQDEELCSSSPSPRALPTASVRHESEAVIPSEYDGLVKRSDGPEDNDNGVQHMESSGMVGQDPDPCTTTNATGGGEGRGEQTMIGEASTVTALEISGPSAEAGKAKKRKRRTGPEKAALKRAGAAEDDKPAKWKTKVAKPNASMKGHTAFLTFAMCPVLDSEEG